jgi:hypothetical protein
MNSIDMSVEHSQAVHFCGPEHMAENGVALPMRYTIVHTTPEHADCIAKIIVATFEKVEYSWSMQQEVL